MQTEAVRMCEKSVSSRRGRTYYWSAVGEDPSKPVLVFLHGLTANHHLFDRQLEYFSPRYPVIAWDAPAHGKSRPYTDFSYANLAGELKRILDAEGVERAVLIGQSAGGFTSQSFLAQYPAMVEGFVSIGSCPYGPGYYSRSDFFWLRQIEWMARLFPDRVLRCVMAAQCGATPPARDNMLRMLEDYPKKELCRLMYLGFAGFIPEVREMTIPCPVCLILGAGDKTGKVRIYNRRWHEKEGYPLHIIPGAAHNANDDQPEAVNAIIQDFLDRLPRHSTDAE